MASATRDFCSGFGVHPHTHTHIEAIKTFPFKIYMPLSNWLLVFCILYSPLLLSSFLISSFHLSSALLPFYTSFLLVCPNPNCLYLSVAFTLNLNPTPQPSAPLSKLIHPSNHLSKSVEIPHNCIPLSISPWMLSTPLCFSFSCSQPLVSLYPRCFSHLHHTLCPSIQSFICPSPPTHQSVSINCTRLSISLD